MSKKRRLLREEITYSTAQSKESNILHKLGYYDQQNQFFSHVLQRHDWIKTIVAHHLGLKSPDACLVADTEEWFHGSFNVCVPVAIKNWKGKQQAGQRVLVRFPLPYRVGESFRPGNGDEKVRCEAGTYAWLQENCPDIPIPRLYGFAMSTGETFTRRENLPFLSRCFHHLRRQIFSWLGRPVPTGFCCHRLTKDQVFRNGGGVGTGYLLIEYIEETRGKMLSTEWFEKHDDIKLRINFFRDLSRILLTLARISLPAIGSFVIDDAGFLQLKNRPLSLGIHELENEEIPTDIPRNYTYSTVDSYVTDLLGTHDSRLRNQPNAINDIGDYLYQTSALTAMRAIFPLFFQRNLRRGPFVFALTDLHQSNIFVDRNWHITALVDLEWGCSRPIEMIQPPHWLTNRAVDQMDSGEYDEIRTEFMEILIAEEEQFSCGRVGEHEAEEITPQLSVVMKRAWETGTFWYTLALSSPSGLFALFDKYIQCKLTGKCKDHSAFHEIMPWYWAQDITSIFARKRSDKEYYDIRLRQAFDDAP